ncbi:uncharacterized protein LOC119836354 [Zerene cesonia]|uniref:uncharacterized protein LOC119836354 n=1 Tax=Zerene cesonia TaxID=33412 RepID=UPI0018E4F782|nr:uncharacterized protein LOC119836354 [Zerene cesonia]
MLFQVQSQRCGCSSPAPTVISSPQIISPPVTTTIVDNSVSNALANALQLLIVSDLLESTLGPALCTNVINAPIIESPYCGQVEVIQQEYITPCGPTVEIVQPCGTPIVETLTPNIFGGYTESFSPLYGSAGPIVERLAPRISPLYRSGCIEKIQPNICGGLTETFSPAFGPGPVIETIQPNIFGGITETLSSLYGPQIVEQIFPNGFGITETITPNYCGGVTEVISPNYYGGISEIVGPTAQFLPNCYGGVTEIVSGPPMAAEVLFPSSIPAQLTRNFGYNVPANTPCVNFNIDPLPFDSCNNFGKSFYY